MPSLPSIPTLLKSTLVLLLTAGSLSFALADDDDEGGSWWGGKRGHSESQHEGSRSSERGNRGERNNVSGSQGSGRAPLSAAAATPYQKECASCHMAYPAGLLPSGSWQHLMGNLNKHFGTDASLDAASQQNITQYLTSQAGTYKRVSEMPAQDRITESYWFQRKHNKHVNASTWARPSIGSRSNCVACHQGAEQGSFDEDSVRIPG